MLLQSILRAFMSLLHPRMLVLMVWPVAAALGLWIVLAFAFWGQAVSAVDSLLRGTPVVEWMYSVAPLAFVAAQLGKILLVLLFVPLVIVTATLIIGVFAMPTMLHHVAVREYPRLARLHGGSAAGSAWNAFVALLAAAVLAIVSLPLWLVPPLWPLLPALLLGYLNYRMFAYDALAEHASRDELRQILGRDRAALFWLGVVAALAGYVPVLGLLAPLYSGLLFIHFGLARLAQLRAAPIEATATRID